MTGLCHQGSHLTSEWLPSLFFHSPCPPHHPCSPTSGVPILLLQHLRFAPVVAVWVVSEPHSPFQGTVISFDLKERGLENQEASGNWGLGPVTLYMSSSLHSCLKMVFSHPPCWWEPIAISINNLPDK